MSGFSCRVEARRGSPQPGHRVFRRGCAQNSPGLRGAMRKSVQGSGAFPGGCLGKPLLTLRVLKATPLWPLRCRPHPQALARSPRTPRGARPAGGRRTHPPAERRTHQAPQPRPFPCSVRPQASAVIFHLRHLIAIRAGERESWLQKPAGGPWAASGVEGAVGCRLGGPAVQSQVGLCEGRAPPQPGALALCLLGCSAISAWVPGGSLHPPPTSTPGPHAQRCPGRGQEKAPGRRRAWRSLSACRGQPLGAADSQLDSGRSARANVTSPGGELSSQWGSGWEWGLGWGGPERGIPSQSLIPARPLLLLPDPAPPAGPGIGFGAGYTSKAISSKQAGRQARLSCTRSTPFLSLRAVPRAGLPAPVVRDQRWASREEPSAKGRPPRIRPAAAGSATHPGPRGGHLGSQGCRVKAWAGKGREVGTFKAGSPWKSHGSKQEPPRRPPEQCCQHPRPQESRGHGAT